MKKMKDERLVVSTQYPWLLIISIHNIPCDGK
jgi:hypothetical protein